MREKPVREMRGVFYDKLTKLLHVHDTIVRWICSISEGAQDEMELELFEICTGFKDVEKIVEGSGAFFKCAEAEVEACELWENIHRYSSKSPIGEPKGA